MCFSVNLGEKREHFWQKGEYTLQVFCFGKPVVNLRFELGDKEIPYTYHRELVSRDTAVSARSFSGEEKRKEGEVLDRLYRLTGLRKVKEEITRICEYTDFIRIRRESGFCDDLPLLHLLFTGHPSAGKNTVGDYRRAILFFGNFVPWKGKSLRAGEFCAGRVCRRRTIGTESSERK